MLKTTLTLQPNRLGEAAINASRQMWLAGLGAAVVTRDWVQSEAGDMFKALVKEGTVVESRAIRFVGDRIETSVSVANTAWKQARRNVESTVKQVADTAVSFAQQVLPTSLPKFELPPVLKTGKVTAKTPTRTKRPAKFAKKATRTVKAGKRAKRA
jgi:hypothetical protein